MTALRRQVLWLFPRLFSPGGAMEKRCVAIALFAAVLLGGWGYYAPTLHSRTRRSRPGCNRFGRRPRSSACRARLSIWPRAASSPICRCPTSSCRAGRSGRRGQPEFVQTPADYLKEPAIERLAVQGRKLLDQYRGPLAGIERQIGVDPTVVLAIFGRETDYGRSRPPQRDPGAGDASLSRQAQGSVPRRISAGAENPGRRSDQACRHAQLLGRRHGAHPIPAVGIFQVRRRLRRRRPPRHLEFNTGRARFGRQAIVDKGWQRGLHWAYEVHPPATIDCTIGIPEYTLPIGEWVKRGFVPAYGRSIPPGEGAESASLLQPSGLYGPSFLATKNYFVIKEYNFSDLYVLFVGHLSDRMRDPRPFETPWGKVANFPRVISTACSKFSRRAVFTTTRSTARRG